MTDSYEHNPGDHEDPLAGPTWLIGIVGAVLLAVSVLGVAALSYQARDVEEVRKVEDVPTFDLETLRANQEARLQGPIRIERRVEGEDSLVIPVDRAMELLVQESGGRRSSRVP